MNIKTPLLTTAAALAATLAFSAGAQTAMPDASSAPAVKDTATTWVQLDKDKDGMITKKEAAGDKELTKNFKMLDMNKDGKLDQTEIAAMDSGTMGSTTKPSSTY